jgi:hypothetical protein
MTARQLRDHVIDRAVEELHELDGARTALEQGDVTSAGDALDRARRRVLQLDMSVPVARAAKLLKVSEPTVRDWIEAGILEVAGEGPLQLTFRSIVETRDELDHLRQAATTGSVRRALLHRIQDRQTLADPRLKQSIEQMRTGSRHYVHKRPES